MKRKYVAAALGIVVSLSMVVTGCAGTSGSSGSSTSSTTEVSASKYAGDTIYGEVTAVSDSSITVDVGTKSDNSASGTSDGASGSSDSSSDTGTADSSSDSSSDTGAADSSSDSSSDTGNAGGMPDMNGSGGIELEKTGESVEVTVTDDTTISRGMGGGPGDGGQNSDGTAQPPKMSSNSGSSDSGNSDSSDSGSSDGTASGMPQGTPPEMNASDNGSGTDSSTSSTSGSSDESTNSSSQAASDGGAPSGSAPSVGAPDGAGGEDLTISDISVGDIVEITFDENGTVTEIKVSGGQMGGGGASSSSDVSYSAVNTYDTDTKESDATVDSTGTDEEGILVSDGATADLNNMTVTRTSSDSTGGDNSSFYGVGAAVLTTEGTTYLNGSTITTDAKGGAGVFSYGENSTTYVKDTTIDTKQDTSGGIHVAGGGTLYAYNLDVTTAGESSAAIRSDRGGGTMVVDGGTYTSNGTGSPAVYSTADIAVNNANLTANSSEAVCIEGSNSVRLFDCDLTGNMSDDDQNDCTWNVILYQSMSGDSEEGNSTFEMDGGTLTAKNGGMFYTTNTESTFYLSDVDITYADENDYFLKCTGNSNERGWGETGSNGADCNFTANNQEMEGDVIWDTISDLDFYMTGNSTLTGAFVDDESNAGSGGDGYANLYIESGSKWVVTGDSTLSALYNAGTITDTDGNTVTIKGTDGKVYVQGTSQYTITISSYSTDVDTSGAASATSWSDYETEAPSELG
jgi:hypothetical protein